MAHKSLIEKGRLVARLAESGADLARVQALRGQVFRAGAPDRDRFDPLCRHVLIEDRDAGVLTGCYRLFSVTDAAGLAASYSAQFYDLAGLARRGQTMLELGRFCLAPGVAQADVLRLAWGALAGLVDEAGAAMLFGCTSFAGTDPAPYQAAFGRLAECHLAPEAWRPGRLAGEVVPFAAGAGDRAAALATMPPLLRSYLGIGGRVSDHAVIDRDLGTLHVFTGVEVGAVPQGRARALRAIAAS